MIKVAGQYVSKFGELWDKDIKDLFAESLYGVLQNSNFEINQIDAIFVANMNAGTYSGQNHLNALVAEIAGVNIPSYRVESACASGGMAINLAYLSIQSGQYNNVLVIGAEKMTDNKVGDVTKGLATAGDEEFEGFYGVTFPSLYAMIARSYLHNYNLKSDILGLPSIKNHFHASLNPNAQFQNTINLEQVNNSSLVSDPLRLLHCSPITDGAAAIILTNDKSNKSNVEFVSSSLAQDTLSLHNREELHYFKSTRIATQKALQSANISISDVSVAEVHDCFSIAELVAYEDLGLAKPGEAYKLLENGDTYLDGKIPVNPSGGLKGCGHPVGATGIKQVAELYQQISGQAGKRQIQKNLAYGLAHNVGGSGATCSINILKNLN
jgi:acetyl-CoA C-acetyltransferase